MAQHHSSSLEMQTLRLDKCMKYFGGIVCTIGGIYLGNGYGAAYWRFGPFNLAWDTFFRGSVLLIIGFILIRFGR